MASTPHVTYLLLTIAQLADRLQFAEALINELTIEIDTSDCIHRQTWQGITFPAGYCAKCGANTDATTTDGLVLGPDPRD